MTVDVDCLLSRKLTKGEMCVPVWASLSVHAVNKLLHEQELPGEQAWVCMTTQAVQLPAGP